MSEDFQTISSIGRKGLLELLEEFETYKSDKIIKSIGDDASVIKNDPSKVSLISSDTFVEGVDFDPTYTPFHHLGLKILSAAINDIYAMNGKPVSALINLAVPNNLSVQMILDLYKGFFAAGHEYEVEIVGGDLTANHSNTVISVTVQGEADLDKITYRSNAKIGDAICVTGDLGGALAGLRILMREKKFWEEHGEDASQPELTDYEYVVKRQLLPSAKKDLIEALAQNNIVPSSMIDLSKGLVNEINEVSIASNLGAYIYQAALPIALETREVANEMEEDVDRYALFGGEDHEMMFTLPEKDVEKFIEYFKDFVVIGRISPKDEGLQMQTAEGTVISFDDLS